MTPQHRQPTRRRLIVVAITAVVICAVGYVSRGWWLPGGRAVRDSQQQHSHGAGDDHADHNHAAGDHGGHDHAADDRKQREEAGAGHAGHDHADDEHPGHDEATTLRLSEEARKNVGLRLTTVERRDFERTITVPAMVAERAGRTRVKVSAPMTGIVRRIYPIRGEAVAPGEPLFDLRMTHEDLVSTQSEFLRTVEELEVIEREVARLEKVTASGAIAGKTLLQRRYEQQKTEAALRAQRQALMLHGLTREQVDAIADDRNLLQQLTIFAPQPAERSSDGQAERLLQVAQLQVEQGQHIAAGETLCVLADHVVLYIEGKAFEEDAQSLNKAANRGTAITAVIAANGKGPHSVAGLKVLYVENEIERDSRALRFYVRLPNELVRNEKTSNGHHFIAWRYKPGQRVELLLPVERWKDRVVLPVGAVVVEGANRFVFQKQGEHFHRQAVHVEYRDQHSVVLGDDATLSPGDVVVTAGAYQMHLAMKNKAKGGADAHAGHHH